MAIQWGGESGHMSVGIEVSNDGYDTNTPSINVYVDVYVRCGASWNFNDSQTVTLSGNASGSWTFQNTLSSNQQRYMGRVTIGGQGQNYNGGPYYSFRAQVSGHYQGATPFVDVGYNLPARPPNVPTPPGIGVDSVTSTGARILVYAPDPRGAGIDAYQTVTSLPGANFGGWTNDFGGGTGTVNNLQPATTYQAATRAHNGVGWSDWAYSGQFTTGATVPGAVTNLSFSSPTQTEVTVNWTAPGNGGSAIGYYELQLADDTGFSVNARTVQINQGSPFTLTGQTPGKRTYGRMRAANGVGLGAYGNVTDFTNLAGTPVITSPVQDANVGLNYARVILTALGIATDRTITVEISQSSTFASGVITLTLSNQAQTSNNLYVLQDTSKYLVSGQWYARAKVTNNTSGYVTPWSTTVGWIEAHIPAAAIVSPTSGATVKYSASPLFTWNFQDAGATDNMTYYQLVVENNATSAVVYDSGKLALTTNSNNAQPSVAVAIPASLKNQVLRWKVRVWDKGDTASPYTGYGLFTLADAPVVTITTPVTATPSGTGAPTFAWTVSVPSGGLQARAVVKVFDSTTNEQVWTGVIEGAATQITPPVVILKNASSYYMSLLVTDSVGLQTETTRTFTTSYSAPSAFPYSVNADAVDEYGYISVSWADANPDDLFARWKVYRRTSATAQWTVIAEITDQNTREYRDYMINSGESFMYSVTQVATRSGSLLESPVGYYLVGATVTPEARLFGIMLSYYWLLNPDQPSLSLRLPNVIGDDGELEFEDATYNIIGRGRHRDYGDELGYKGTLVCQVRENTLQSTFRNRMETLRRAKETYYLRTPFGRLIPVALGNLGWTPVAGVGVREMGDMSIPYEEVR